MKSFLTDRSGFRQKATILIIAAICAFGLSAEAQYFGTAPAPTVVVSSNTSGIYTNAIGGAVAASFNFPAYFTNLYTNSSGGVTNTNTVTNYVTGWVDNSKQGCFTPRVSFQTTSSTNATNIVTLTWQPSLDGITADTTNAGFVQTATANGTNFVVATTNFPSTTSQGQMFFQLQKVQTTGSAVVSNLNVDVGPKRMFAPY
jgi:hypothetical protein